MWRTPLILARSNIRKLCQVSHLAGNMYSVPIRCPGLEHWSRVETPWVLLLKENLEASSAYDDCSCAELLCRAPFSVFDDKELAKQFCACDVTVLRRAFFSVSMGLQASAPQSVPPPA